MLGVGSRGTAAACCRGVDRACIMPPFSPRPMGILIREFSERSGGSHAKSSGISRRVCRPGRGRPGRRHRDARAGPDRRPRRRRLAPMDTAVLRAQYDQWRTQFKTWGKWAPLGQESKGTTNLITPEKVASAMRLAKDGIVVSLAHAEPQTVAADVGARRHLPPRHQRHHRWRHDGQLPGQLPRPDDRAYRHVVSLLRERADVQRGLGEGQPDAPRADASRAA